MDEIVDPTVLGGFVVENGTMVLDGSLRGQLQTIRGRLESGARRLCKKALWLEK